MSAHIGSKGLSFPDDSLDGRRRREGTENAKFHTLRIQRIMVNELLHHLGTTRGGLPAPEAEKRRKEMRSKSDHRWNRILSIFFEQISKPLPLLIAVAAVFSAIVHRYTDFAILNLFLFMTLFLTYHRGRKTGKIIEALRQNRVPRVRIMRNGQWSMVPASELMTGDIVELSSGDIVAADVKLIDGEGLECEEVDLNDNSILVERRVLDDVQQGAVVVRGEAMAVVTAAEAGPRMADRETGPRTRTRLEAAVYGEKGSGFENSVLRFRNQWIAAILFLAAIVLLVSIFRHHDLMEALRITLILITVTVPASLAGILDYIQVVGASMLMNRKAVVRDLSAIEKVACMDMLCCDLTGNVTLNRYTTAEAIAGPGFETDDVYVLAALASRCCVDGPAGRAIRNQVQKTESLVERINDYKVIDKKPVLPESGPNEVKIADRNSQVRTVSMGAPRIIFKLFTEKDSVFTDFREKAHDYALMGYRIVAVAVKESEDPWRLAGLIPLSDPLRNEGTRALKEIEAMGVKVKLLSEDNVPLAASVLRKLGLGSALSAGRIMIHPHEIDPFIEKKDALADLSPKNKPMLVRVMQKLGHFVGMTGAGVNDARALNAADCGLAVAGATEAARSMADIVLNIPGLPIIADVIKQCRKILQRNTGYILDRIARSVWLFLFVALSIVLLNFYPLTAFMLAVLGLLGSVPALDLSAEPVDFSVRPEKWPSMKAAGLGASIGLFGILATFLLLYIGKDIFHFKENVLSSFLFLHLALSGQFLIFVTRTRARFWLCKPSSKLLCSAIVSTLAVTILATNGWLMAPLGWKFALFDWAYMLGVLAVADIIKFMYLYHL